MSADGFQPTKIAKKKTEQNPGWLYIQLPQSVYLTDPEGRRHYFGYADPRFKYFDQGLTFREIVTYSFLGCGEFIQDPDQNVWRNQNFAIPGGILDMLIEANPSDRDESFTIWKNAYSRSPELVEMVGKLKTIRSFTRDGMCLYSSDKLSNEFINTLQAHGFRFFSYQQKLPKLETILETSGLPGTRVFKKLMLDALLRTNTFHPVVLGWIRLVFDLYGLDRAQQMLTKDYEQCCRCGQILMDGTEIKERPLERLKKFFKGLTFEQFRRVLAVEDKTALNGLLVAVTEQLETFTKHFSLDPKETEPPYLWGFLRQHRIDVEHVVAVFQNPERANLLFVPIHADIPVLYKDDKYLIRSPANGMEVLTWGHKLLNCLRYRTGYTAMVGYWLFGVYEEEKLIAALEINSDLRITELRGLDNKNLPEEKNSFLRKKILKALVPFDPMTKVRADLIKIFKGLEGKEVTDSVYHDLVQRTKEYLEGLLKCGVAVPKLTPEQLVVAMGNQIPSITTFVANRNA